MKIAVVHSVISSGNVNPKFYGVQQFGFCEGLAEQGNEVLLISSYPGGDANAFMDFGSNKFHVKYYKGYLNKFNQTIVLGFWKDLSRFKPDVVIIGEDQQITSFIVTLWARINKVPIILHQGLYYLSIRKMIFHKLFLKSFGKIIHKSISLAIAKTTSASEYLIRTGLKKERILICPVGIDRNFISSSISTENDTELLSFPKPYLFQYSRLVKEKDPVKFIEIAFALSKLNKNFSYVLLGDGPLKEELEEKIKLFNLENKITLISKMIDRRQIAKLIKDAAFTTITSTHEIFNMTMLESLYLGVPVVATKIGGMADVIIDGYNGFFIDSQDVEVTARKILQAYNDKYFYDKLKTNAEISAKKYDWSIIGKDINNFISNKLKK